MARDALLASADCEERGDEGLLFRPSVDAEVDIVGPGDTARSLSVLTESFGREGGEEAD